MSTNVTTGGAYAEARISAEQLKNRLDRGEKITIVDARNPDAYRNSNEKLPGAMRITNDDGLIRIPKNDPVVVYCT